MNIKSNSYSTHNFKPAFGKIDPQHLFINAPKYSKNLKWANHTIGLIEEAKTKVGQKVGFSELMEFISTKYGEFFRNNNKKLPSANSNPSRNFFGILRTHEFVSTPIAKKNRYSSYVERFTDFLQKNGEDSIDIFDPFMPLMKVFRGHIPNSSVKEKLSTISATPTNYSEEEIRKFFGDYIIELSAPHPDSIKPVFEIAEKIYKSIINSKTQSIKKTTEDVAKIHWYLSQVTPYCRGSAGIADVLSKIIFESKGIQVSPYRPKVDPNLEAYVMSIGEYSKKYETFFEKPLTFIKES